LTIPHIGADLPRGRSFDARRIRGAAHAAHTRGSFGARCSLLQIPLHGIGVAGLCLIGIGSGFPEGPTLA
jgi:hypothetical protein